jgi:hypothetical protein
MSNPWSLVLAVLILVAPCLAQPADEAEPEVIQGYIFQNAITAQSYVLTNAEELKAFVATLPPTVPSKTVPAPPNPDPFLKGMEIDFEQSVVAVAVRLYGITKHPRYDGTDVSADGQERRVYFLVAAHDNSEAYPFGWAVYSAVVLPRTESTVVIVEALPAKGR